MLYRLANTEQSGEAFNFLKQTLQFGDQGVNFVWESMRKCFGEGTIDQRTFKKRHVFWKLWKWIGQEGKRFGAES